MSLARRVCQLLLLAVGLSLGAESLAADDAFPFIRMEDVVVNVGESPGHYARVQMQLEVNSKEDMQAVKDKMPIVRDRILLALGGRPLPELRDVSKRQALREELTTAVNEALVRYLGRPPLKDILFTGFIVQ